MTVVAAEPTYTFREWTRILRDTKDKSYQSTRLGADVLDYLAWKRLQRAAARTLDQYERDLRVLCLVAPARLEETTVAHLMLAMEHVPPGSWKRVQAAWRDFFKWSVRVAQRRPDNPVDLLPKIKPSPPPVYDLWSQAELDLLVAATRRMENPRLERIRVLTMIETGARAGEMQGPDGIKLGSFDLYRRTVTVIGKGRRPRIVPVSEELKDAIDEYALTPYPLLDRDPHQDDYLWYPVYRVGRRIIGLKPERHLSYRGFYEWWRRVEQHAGVRHRKPHMTRHTFATDVLDATEGDLYAVKELLGHSSTKVTEVYLHSSRRRTGHAMDALHAYRAANRQTGND